MPTRAHDPPPPPSPPLAPFDHGATTRPSDDSEASWRATQPTRGTKAPAAPAPAAALSFAPSICPANPRGNVTFDSIYSLLDSPRCPCSRIARLSRLGPSRVRRTCPRSRLLITALLPRPVLYLDIPVTPGPSLQDTVQPAQPASPLQLSHLRLACRPAQSSPTSRLA